MIKNQTLSDYVYLAEASYADFSKAGRNDGSYNTDWVNNAIKNPKKDGGLGNPESFAELVTQNYEVVAHYKDRVASVGWALVAHAV